jgi:hypothetical protein
MRLPHVLTALAAFAVSLAAHADTTYTIVQAQSYYGDTSGTVTGTGLSLTGFDVMTSDGGSTYTFDSSQGATGSIADTGYTTFDGTEAYVITLTDPLFDQFMVAVTGDFTSGLTAVGGQDAYSGSNDVGTFFSAVTQNAQALSVVNDAVTFVPASSATPEPSSLALLGTGILGIAGLVRKRLL